MKVLVLTAMWPRPENPAFGIFVKREVESLRRHHPDLGITVLAQTVGRSRYIRLGRAAWSSDANVVHAHYGLVGFAASAARPPLVVTYHGSDTRGWALTFSRIAARRAAWNIAVSRSVAVALGTDRLTENPMAVDDQLFAPADKAEARRRLGWNTQRPVVLFGADPRRPVKGYPLFSATVELLGTAVEAKALAPEGPVDPVEVAMKLQASDVLLFTSRSEGSPLIIREALSVGLPVVSVRVGDVPTVAEVAEGVVLADRSPVALARAVRLTLESGLRPDHKRAADIWGTRAAADRLYSVYQRVAR